MLLARISKSPSAPTQRPESPELSMAAQFSFAPQLAGNAADQSQVQSRPLGDTPQRLQPAQEGAPPVSFSLPKSRAAAAAEMLSKGVDAAAAKLKAIGAYSRETLAHCSEPGQEVAFKL